MAKLVVDKASLVSVADAIRTKGNTTDELEFPNGFVDGINAIESGGGGTEEIENIIDASGVLESTDGTVTDKIEQLVDYSYLLKNQYGIRVYNNNDLEHINFYIDWLTEFKCEYARNLKTVVGVDASKLNSCRGMFAGCASLVSIQVPFDMSKHNAYHMENMFSNCISLVDVRFVKETIKESITILSPVLSNDSIKSILRGLAYVDTTQTLKVSQIVFNKLLENEFYDYWDEALNKGWDITN